MPLIITADTTWTAGSTINLTQDVQVAHGVRLTIEAGAVVEGNGHALNIWGALDVRGASSNRCVLENVRVNYGTTTSPSQTARIDIDHAIQIGGSFLEPMSNAVYGSFSLTNSLVADTDSYAYVWYPVAESVVSGNVFLRTGGFSTVSRVGITFSDNVFKDWTTGYAIENLAAYDGAVIDVVGNSFLSTDRIALKLPPGYDAASMTAVGNYFGTTDEQTIAAMVFDKSDDLSSAAVIPYTPFLASPSDAAPSLPSLTNGSLDADTYTGTSARDWIIGRAGNDVLAGAGGNDYLIGGDGNDTLNGGPGNDTLNGGAGNDTYMVDTHSTGDVVVERGGGNDLVQSSVVYTLTANVERLTLIGVANVNGAGNALDNVLTGNAGNNQLLGNGGNDLLVGGAGNDRLNGGLGNDTMTGQAGADTLLGGAGDDTYIMEADTDVVSESQPTGGIDTVRSAVSYSLGPNLEHLVLFGDRGVYVNGTGNALGNRITGNTFLNTLIGNDGNDTLNGGAGIDRLQGGYGNDTLVWTPDDALIAGGNGEDTLLFPGSGRALSYSGVISDIEITDITGSAPDSDNSLALSRASVLAFSTSTDTLRVIGDTGDLLRLTGGGWTAGAVAGDTRSYSNAGATVIVDTDMTTTLV